MTTWQGWYIRQQFKPANPDNTRGTTTVYSSKSGAPVATATETKAKPAGFVVDDRLPKLDSPEKLVKKVEEEIVVKAVEGESDDDDDDEPSGVESKSAAKKKAKAKKVKKDSKK